MPPTFIPVPPPSLDLGSRLLTTTVRTARRQLCCLTLPILFSLLRTSWCGIRIKTLRKEPGTLYRHHKRQPLLLFVLPTGAPRMT